jgi:hypothetical protein
MNRYLNGWIALAAWLVLMGVVWVVFVPGSLAPGSFALLLLTGPLAGIVFSMLWRSQQPAPSVGQQRVLTDEADTTTRAKK